MTISDILIGNEGVFSFIQKNVPIEFLKSKSIYLDILLVGKHGERKVSPLLEVIFKDGVTNESMNSLGFVLGSMFLEKWEYTNKLLMEDLPTDVGEDTVTETISNEGTKDTEENRTSTNKNINSVSAFDEVGFSDDKKTDVEDSEISLNKDTDKSIQTREKITSRGIGSVVYNKRVGLDFQKSNVLFDILINDVVEEMATLIF